MENGNRKIMIVNKRRVKINKKQKVIYIIVMFQSILSAIVFMCSKIFKWELIEKLTIFLYPIYKGIILLSICISFIISLAYAIKKYKAYMIKAFYPLMIGIIIIFLNEREMIVEQALTGEIVFDETGTLELENYNKKIIAPNTNIYTISNGKMMGIYFCTFSGLPDSSSGYLYVVDLSEEISCYPCNIDIKEQFDTNCYYISIY